MVNQPDINMKKLLTTGLFTIALCLLSLTTFAQKFGHLNSGNLLIQLPETKAADASLETYQKQLGDKFQKKIVDFRTRAQKFISQAQDGTLPKVEIAKRQEALTKEEQALAKEEAELTQKVQQKREELLAPILQKVDKAIKDVGKENGYRMIFDTSILNSVLFAQDADDVMPMVKAKLGI